MIDPNHTREQALEAFHHEITAMWSLSFHPNVVKLIAFDDATTSMVQPLYDVCYYIIISFLNETKKKKKSL